MFSRQPSLQAVCLSEFRQQQRHKKKTMMIGQNARCPKVLTRLDFKGRNAPAVETGERQSPAGTTNATPTREESKEVRFFGMLSQCTVAQILKDNTHFESVLVRSIRLAPRSQLRNKLPTQSPGLSLSAPRRPARCKFHCFFSAAHCPTLRSFLHAHSRVISVSLFAPAQLIFGLTDRLLPLRFLQLLRLIFRCELWTAPSHH